LIVIFTTISSAVSNAVSVLTKNPILMYALGAIVALVVTYNYGYNKASDECKTKIAMLNSQAIERAQKHDAQLQRQVETLTIVAAAKDKEIIVRQREALAKYQDYLQKLKSTPVNIPIKTKDAKGKEHEVLKTVTACPVDSELLRTLSLQ
jgi:hypothetical protein